MNKNKKQEIFNSSFLKKSKKAELTTQQIVILIVLIMSFIVILYFLFRLNFGETSEKEICHNSVVMKGNPVLSKGAVSLNCQRTYVCLTKDGSCEQMTNPNIKKVETLPEIYEVLADEMAGCWWMFGEGEINYVGKDFKSNLYCSICSQLAFDNSVKDITEKISEKEFYQYLGDKEIVKGESYLKYLFDLDNVGQLEESFSKEGGSFEDFNLDKQYFVMTGIFSEVGVGRWVLGVGAGGAIIATGIILSPFTGGLSAVATASIIASSSVAGGFAGKYLGTAVKGDSGYDFLAPTILEANSEEFEVFNCKDILTLT